MPESFLPPHERLYFAKQASTMSPQSLIELFCGLTRRQESSGIPQTLTLRKSKLKFPVFNNCHEGEILKYPWNHYKKIRPNIFLDVPRDRLLVCQFILTVQNKCQVTIWNYQINVSATKQEIWLAVYSRSNLIGVKYIHLSLTHSPIDPSITYPTCRLRGNFYKKITQKLLHLKSTSPTIVFISANENEFDKNRNYRCSATRVKDGKNEI